MERHGAAPVVEVGDAGPKVVKQKEGTDKNAADRLLWQPGFPETGATRPSWLSRGSTLDRLRSQARGVYKAAESGAERYTRRERPCTCPETDFESKLLTTSAEYYRSKVAGWTAACARFSKAWEALIPAALMAYCRCLPSLKLQHLEFVSCFLASVPFVGPKKEGSAKLRQEGLGVQSRGQTKASQIACCLLALCCLQRLHCGRGWVSVTFNMLFLDEFRLCKRRKHQCRELFVGVSVSSARLRFVWGRSIMLLSHAPLCFCAALS